MSRLLPVEARGPGRAFSVQKDGMLKWGDLFTARQKLALPVLSSAVRTSRVDPGMMDLLGLVIDRVASRSSSLCQWRHQADQEKVEHTFARQPSLCGGTSGRL
jgi:putative DNA methylase